MKKLLFLLLSAAVAISASAGIDQARTITKVMPKAQAKTGLVSQNAKHTNFVTSLAQPARAFKAPAKVDIPDGYCAITLEAHQVWNTDPEYPDYSGYQMLLDADATAYGVEFLEPGASGSGQFSGSYDAFEYKIPENADGDLETQNIVYDGSVTILVPAGTYDYVITNPTPGDQLWIASEYGNMGGRADDVTFVAGRSYLFLITLGSNGNDRTDLYETTVPENLTVAPGDVFANVEWEDNDDVAWNLRWRPYTEGGDGILWDFPIDDLSWMSEWYTVDADGDENDWEPSYLDENYTNAGWYSESWSSANGASDPDNWLISPETALQGTLSFLMGGVTSWPDHIGVYAVIGWDPSTGYAPSLSDLILIDEFDCSSDANEATFTADLSQFNGQVGRLVFRHFNSYNNYYVYLDDIRISGSSAPWTYVNDLDVTNYTIEGLTPNTKYEVQVQADGTIIDGDWTEIVEFITTAPIPDVYILGEVNDQTWGANVGTKMDYNAEDNIYTATVTLDGRNSGYNYFSFTTVLAENNDDGGWNYIKPFRIGALSDGNFLVEDQYLNVPLDLTQGENAFQTPAGQYKLTVDLANMKLIIEKVVPAHNYENGDVNHDHEVNIADVTTLIDYLLGTGTVCEICADVNGDGPINIADVTALIDILLGN